MRQNGRKRRRRRRGRREEGIRRGAGGLFHRYLCARRRARGKSVLDIQ